jgi:hypothetical protein
MSKETKEKGLFARLFGLLDDEERKEAAGLFLNDSAPPPPSQSSHVDAETLRKAQAYDEVQKQNRERAAAEFAQAQITDQRKILPFGLDGLKAEYLQRAEDDDRMPLAQGSRVANLSAIFEALPSHNLTAEQAAAKLPENATVLENNDDPQKASIKQAAESARAYGERANQTGPRPVAK